MFPIVQLTGFYMMGTLVAKGLSKVVNKYTSLFFKSSHLKVFCKKCVSKNFAKFTGKHMSWSLFFNKVAGFRPATFLKKRHQHRHFPVNFAKVESGKLCNNFQLLLEYSIFVFLHFYLLFLVFLYSIYSIYCFYSI